LDVVFIILSKRFDKIEKVNIHVKKNFKKSRMRFAGKQVLAFSG